MCKPYKALHMMPFGKRLKNMNNLGEWASFNERKCASEFDKLM